MSLRVITDPASYNNIGLHHRLATGTLRELPATHKVHLNSEGVPFVPKDFTDYRERQEDISDYVEDLYQLNEPLETLLEDDNRVALNDEIARFSFGPYLGEATHPENPPQFVVEALSDTSLAAEDERDFFSSLNNLGFFDNAIIDPSSTTPQQKQLLLDLGNLFKDETGIGTEIDWSPEATLKRDKAWRLMSEKRRNFQREENVRTHYPQFALLGLMCSDPGYISSVLTSPGMGLMHPNENVRLGTVNLLKGLVLVTPGKLMHDLAMSDRMTTMLVGPDKEGTTKSEHKQIYLDALSGLRSVLGALYTDHFGINDRNYGVQDRAKELESLLLKLCTSVSKVVKSIELS